MTRSGHCCPGEWPTTELILSTARILAGKVRYEVPEQDLSIGASRMPALPKSGFVMRNVSFEDEGPLGSRMNGRRLSLRRSPSMNS